MLNDDRDTSLVRINLLRVHELERERRGTERVAVGSIFGAAAGVRSCLDCCNARRAGTSGAYFPLAYKEIFVQIEDYSAEVACNRLFVLCHGINRNYTSR